MNEFIWIYYQKGIRICERGIIQSGQCIKMKGGGEIG